MSQVFNENGKIIPVTLVRPKNPADCSLVSVGMKVVLSGISKGKGFAGVMKRWGFRGGPATHGQSDRARGPGSIGSTTTPGRVYKGKKMAGRLGGARVTIKGLKIVEVSLENNLVKVSGAVPGARNGRLMLTGAEVEK